MMKTPNELYIDGAWRPSSDGRTIPLMDPATEQEIDRVPMATTQDLDDALAAADRGWRAWREVDAWSRSAALRKVASVLRERADFIAAVMTEEMGKPLGEARAEALAAADQFDWYADEARRIYGRTIDGHSRANRLIVIRQPIGPVAAFSPWNFPCMLAARKIAPAMAAGCSIIVKPAREAPRSALCLAQACHDTDVPAGVVNVVTGDSALISTHLVRSDVIRKVSLTGSVDVGRAVLQMCAEGIKPASMELGGHSPVVVFADADVDRAAELCARGKFRNCGQVCIAASRFYVQEPVYERFVERFTATAQGLKLGDGREPGTEVGPLANRRRIEATDSLLQDAVAKGARLRCGGRRAEGFERGFFYEPAVITDVDPNMRVMNEEPFCPIAPIAPFRDLDDAIAKANATPFGLAAYVFTRDLRTAVLASEGIEAGMVGVNHLLISTAEIPFGGIKVSGYGREGGSEGIDAYTVTKHVSIAL